MAKQISTRHTVIAMMRSAFRGGMSASKFISEMQAKGLSYRRTRMLADWRTINEIEKKEGLVRYVRRDRLPSEKSLAAVSWELSQEYMYKVKTLSRLAPGQPITERFVTILSDIPLRPGEVISEIVGRWGGWEKYAGERLVEAQPWSAYRRVPE